ncbi:MAG: pantoate--beta-alanine ligase [Pseudomonadota bacterium]
MIIARTPEALHDALGKDGTLVLVPTMGNLHAGHLSLIRKGLEVGDRVVASIFVNPTQFGPGEDFERYPRTLDADVSMLADAGCHAVFAPDVDVLYPFGAEHTVSIHVPEVTDILCGSIRPGHFDGVATVVAKLFLAVAPDVAVFGRKDYQQLVLIRRLVRDLGFPIDIVAGDIVREADGLAMSSRNAYLEAADRAAAPAIYRALAAVREAVERQATLEEAIASGHRTLAVAGLTAEYIELRRAGDLGPAGEDDAQLVALIAAQVGAARLIDNVRILRQER